MCACIQQLSFDKSKNKWKANVLHTFDKRSTVCQCDIKARGYFMDVQVTNKRNIQQEYYKTPQHTPFVIRFFSCNFHANTTEVKVFNLCISKTVYYHRQNWMSNRTFGAIVSFENATNKWLNHPIQCCSPSLPYCNMEKTTKLHNEGGEQTKIELENPCFVGWHKQKK